MLKYGVDMVNNAVRLFARISTISFEKWMILIFHFPENNLLSSRTRSGIQILLIFSKEMELDIGIRIAKKQGQAD